MSRLKVRDSARVYLLHLEGMFPEHDKPIMHYLGSADSVPDRVAAHKRGNGARLLQIAAEREATVTLVRTWWTGGRGLEYWIKRKHKRQKDLCPICNPDTKEFFPDAIWRGEKW